MLIGNDMSKEYIPLSWLRGRNCINVQRTRQPKKGKLGPDSANGASNGVEEDQVRLIDFG